LKVKQLQHLNKDRPKRANVKRPTVKNPQAKIEIEAKLENLEEEVAETTTPTSTSTTALNKSDEFNDNKQQTLQTPNNDESSSKINGNKSVSPTAGVKSATGQGLAEQPKISQNALENVKLRSTVRFNTNNTNNNGNNKSDETTTTTTTTTTAATNPLGSSRIANRLSMFEQNKELQLEKDNKPFMNIKLKKTSLETSANVPTNETNEAANEGSGLFKILQHL
jgi:hypothetical protein